MHFTIERVQLADLRTDPEIAELVPDVTDAEEGKEFIDGIKERGILIPLFVTRDLLVLDGHRRFKAAQELQLQDVPVIRLTVDGVGVSWKQTLAITLNLSRRQLNEAQRGILALNILKYEEAEAQARQHEGQKVGGETAGKHRPKESQLGGYGTHQADDQEPPSPSKRKEDNLAKSRAAKRAGVSRKTMERVETVIASSDQELKGDMLSGKVSVSSAARQAKIQEVKEKALEDEKRVLEVVPDPTVIIDITTFYGRCRTILQDPPWELTTEVLGAQYGPHILRLAHPEGTHLWTWASWEKIRTGEIHSYLIDCGFRWVGEIVWWRKGMAAGRWLKPMSEVLILAIRGDSPLLDRDIATFRGQDLADAPGAVHKLIEQMSPGPRLELFAKEARAGWFRNEHQPGVQGEKP